MQTSRAVILFFMSTPSALDTLDVLLELQSLHDNLKVIERDLSAFPPEMAGLDDEQKKRTRRQEQVQKELDAQNLRIQQLDHELKLALRLEEHAKAALKETKNKIQYTAAIRELDERERHRASVAKPLKELQAKQAELQAELESLVARLADVKAQFDGLHEIFLAEHENQVAARSVISARRQVLEGGLDPQELVRFNRLMQQRQGKAVVAIENGTCSGCRTNVRSPFMGQIREHGFLPCESCQRILYIPGK